MPKNVKGFHWVKITDEQYRIANEMSEPDTRSAKNQFEPVSFIAGWCIESMQHIPQALPRMIANDTARYRELAELVRKWQMAEQFENTVKAMGKV